MVNDENHKWAWILIFLIGGVLMIYGGVQDIMIYFVEDLPVASWHTISPEIALICGIIVLISALLTIYWSLQAYKQIENHELTYKIAQKIVVVNFIATITDWICGYYGFGSLVALIIAILLIRKKEEN
ncbi:MAG: hypothetical protein ACTSYA_02925 [Candidatus Kariarchaeaceae archaeon]